MANLSDVLTSRNIVVGTTSGGGGGTTNTFTGTGDPGLTRAQHMTVTYVTPPNAIRTTGYATTDDQGEGLYIKSPGNVQPDHKGKFQTADGTWYELKHNGRVTAAQFGAKSNTGAEYNRIASDVDITGPLNDAVDYICFNRFGGCGELYIHGGAYYMSGTVQLKGNFNVRGASKNATFIMPGAYVTAFVGHHPTYSFEAFGGNYGWSNWMVGQTMFTPGGTPGTPSAHAYICTVAGTTSSDGSQKPTGTGTNYLDGTARFDYYREATRVELKTDYWQGQLHDLTLYSHFDGSVISGTSSAQPPIYAPAPGPWSQSPSGTGYTWGPWKPSFGFLGRGRSHVHHCDMMGFSAHGCAYMANGDFDFPTVTGNVNFWCVTDCAFYYNAMDGLHSSYSDGNAGYAAHIDVASNGRWGIRDQSFLGNMYVQVQSANDGRADKNYSKRFPSAVTYAGYYYYAKLGNIGASPMPNWGAVTPTPGASNNAWSLLGGDGTWVSDGWLFPNYVAGRQYEPGGAYASDNINARNLWNSCYIEGGTFPAQFNGRDVIIGGLMQNLFIGTGANLLSDNAWFNAVYYQSRGNDFSAGIGGQGRYAGVGETILNWHDGIRDRDYGLQTDTYESGRPFNTANWAWMIDRGIYGYWIRQGQDSKFYGRATPLDGGQFAFHNLFIGSDGDCRQVDFMDAAPTSGSWARGDRVFKRNPAVGQPKGWICTVAGTPGTWVSEGNL